MSQMGRSRNARADFERRLCDIEQPFWRRIRQLGYWS